MAKNESTDIKIKKDEGGRTITTTRKSFELFLKGNGWSEAGSSSKGSSKS